MVSQYRYPFRFYLLSTIIPWLFWLIAAYLSWRENADQYGMHISVLGLFGLFGPLIIAAVFIQRDKALVTDVWGRFFNFNSTKLVYILVAVILMPASIILAMAISLLFGYDVNQFIVTGQATFSSGVLPIWFILIIAPILEELGWHSYGTDCLRQKYSLFISSMIFAVIWGVWHLPLGLIQGYYHSNLVVEGVIHGINFLVSLFPFVLLMNWLYYKTNRNILVTVILHLNANVFNEIFATHPDSKIIQTVLLCILSMYLIKHEREFFFNLSYEQPNQQGKR